MRNRTVKSLLWWLPALLLAVAASILPDTFLDSPYTTIPHEAAFVVRFWIIVSAFGYIALVVAIRAALGKRRHFPVVTVNSRDQSAG